MQQPTESPSSGRELLCRFYWMFLGIFLMLFSLMFILQKRPGFPSLYDAVYGFAVVSVIAVRFADIRFFGGRTGEGGPAKMKHWRRHAMFLGAVGVGAWVLVRASVYLLR